MPAKVLAPTQPAREHNKLTHVVTRGNGGDATSLMQHFINSACLRHVLVFALLDCLCTHAIDALPYLCCLLLLPAACMPGDSCTCLLISRLCAVLLVLRAVIKGAGSMSVELGSVQMDEEQAKLFTYSG